jgi:tetratricopeptide (TPR) repeat protein
MSKAGRNDPCPCGSGKKYKQCCLEQELSQAANTRREIQSEAQWIASSFTTAFNYHQQGRQKEAQEIYQAILQKQPNHAKAMHYLGVIAYQNKQYDIAGKLINRSIELEPNVAEYYCNYGLLLIDQERYEQVVESQRKALQLMPNYAEPYLNLSVALFKLGRYAESAQNARKTLELDPNNVKAYDNLGTALRFLYDFSGSIKSHERAIELNPNYVIAYSSIAATYLEVKNLTAMSAYCRQAIALDPNHAHAYLYLGLACQEQGKLEQAEPFMLHAATLAPDDYLIHWNISLLMLAMGKLEIGWRNYEARWELEQLLPVRMLHFPYPWWQGQLMPDKTILIWYEQGIGDQIMFASMYEDVIARFKQCIIVTPQKLMTLLARSFPKAHIVCKDDKQQLDALQDVIDVQSAVGSLTRWLRPTVTHFPRKNHYLIPDADRTAYWKQRLAELGEGLKIGLCWRSSNVAGGRQLYCTNIEQWRPILSLPGVHFVNLQYDECAAEIAQVGQLFGTKVHVFPEVDLFDDLDETAALTKALDLIIAIPTASAILGAALGAPTWMLSSGFTWQKLGTAENCWYATARHFQRSWDQPWEAFLAELAVELQTKISLTDTQGSLLPLVGEASVVRCPPEDG